MRVLAALFISGTLLSRPARAADSLESTTVVGVAAGLTAGTGRLDPDRNSHVVGAAGAVAFELNHAFHETVHLGAYGSYASYLGSTSANVSSGYTLGLHGQYRPRGRAAFNPYFGLGAGYHGLVSIVDGSHRRMRDGLELVRARVGFDYPVAPATRVGPLVGVDVTWFFGEHGDTPGPGAQQAVLPFFFAGLSGTFDLVGPRD